MPNIVTLYCFCEILKSFSFQDTQFSALFSCLLLLFHFFVVIYSKNPVCGNVS